MDMYSFGSSLHAEYLYKVKADTGIKVIRAIIVAVGVVLSAVFFLVMSSLPQVVFLWVAAVVFFCYMAFAYTQREFEYDITDDVLELSVIYGKRMRRKVCEFKIGEAVSIDRASLSKQSVLRHTEGKKVVFACDKEDENMCTFVISEGEKKSIVVLSVPDKMYAAIKRYSRCAF